MVRAHFAALAALWLAGPAAGQQPTFMAGGQTFTLDRYPPTPDTNKRPVVVIVHGIDGMGGTSGPQIKKFAEEIADKGYLVAVPHYFSPADGSDSDPVERLVELRLPKFRDYVPRITAAAEAAVKLPDADGDRVGLVGFSLGGGLALKSAQSAPAGKTKAVVDFFGYIPEGSDIYANAGKLPPTLILHSNDDPAVDVRVSKELVAALKRDGVVHDYHFYDGRDHPFRPGSTADTNSRQRALDWLKKHVR